MTIHFYWKYHFVTLESLRMCVHMDKKWFSMLAVRRGEIELLCNIWNTCTYLGLFYISYPLLPSKGISEETSSIDTVGVHSSTSYSSCACLCVYLSMKAQYIWKSTHWSTMCFLFSCLNVGCLWWRSAPLEGTSKMLVHSGQFL